MSESRLQWKMTEDPWKNLSKFFLENVEMFPTIFMLESKGTKGVLGTQNYLWL